MVFSEWISLALGGVVLVFVYSKMVYYSSLYVKANEEYAQMTKRNESLSKILKRYEAQSNVSLNSIKKLKDEIKGLEVEIKEVLILNKRLKKEISEYEEKMEVLYSQVEKTI